MKQTFPVIPGLNRNPPPMSGVMRLAWHLSDYQIRMSYIRRAMYVFLRHIVTEGLQSLCGRGIEGVTEMWRWCDGVTEVSKWTMTNKCLCHSGLEAESMNFCAIAWLGKWIISIESTPNRVADYLMQIYILQLWSCFSYLWIDVFTIAMFLGSISDFKSNDRSLYTFCSFPLDIEFNDE